MTFYSPLHKRNNLQTVLSKISNPSLGFGFSTLVVVRYAWFVTKILRLRISAVLASAALICSENLHNLQKRHPKKVHIGHNKHL